MKTLLVSIMASALVLGACDKKSQDKKSGKATGDARYGGATAEEVARKFVSAAAKRDRAAAEKCLMDESLCKLAPPAKRAGCPAYLKQVKAVLPEYLKRVPKDFVPGKVEKDPNMPEGREVTFYDVFPKGGGKPVSVVVMPLGGRYYVFLPVKRKVKTVE
jgi:hypothetical protein